MTGPTVTGPTVTVARPGPTRAVQIGGHVYPVRLPTWRDPRLHLAAVITTLQVLGQVALGFELSISQILAAILTCAVIEVAVVFRREQVIAWPASAMLTGNGVAFVLRVSGTRHGDWWSTNGIGIFVATAAFALATKYLVRFRGAHVFNPSNIGLVVCFLLLGPSRVNPLDLWWGPLSPALVVALTAIAVGAVAITVRLRMMGIVAGFWFTFAACIGVLAWSGHSMTARWHVGPVAGWSYWWILLTSPEILVFCFFMITDPRTTPRGRVARVAFGASVAVAASVLVALQTTEFGVKVSILGALASVCLLRPLLERWLPTPGLERDAPKAWVRDRIRGATASPLRIAARLGASVVLVLVLGVTLAALGTGARAATVHRGDARRPVVRGVAVPPVDVNTTNQVAAVTAAEARVMARDVVADLRIQTDALRGGDAALAATAGDRAWLVKLRRRIAHDGPDASEPAWRVKRITISTARRPHQGPPAILATLRGQRVPPGAGRPRGVTTSFEIAWDGREYLLVSDDMPPGWTRPA